MKNSTTVIPIKTSPPRPLRVRIQAFNTSTLKWKKLSLDWLRQMEAEKFECTQGHTLNISGGCQIQFVIFVCERVTSLTTPLPPRIYFDHFEITTQVGHAIMADYGPPVSIKVLDDFWQRGGGNGGGDTPHFKDLVLPLVHELISAFGRESTWAS